MVNMKNKSFDEIDEILRRYGIGLKEICMWFIHYYPEDIFVSGPKEIVTIREECKKILKKIK